MCREGARDGGREGGIERKTPRLRYCTEPQVDLKARRKGVPKHLLAPLSISKREEKKNQS